MLTFIFYAENVFSSLVGVQFIWKLVPKSSDVERAVHHLVHVPLKDTPLSDCGGSCGDLNTQIKLEDRVCALCPIKLEDRGRTLCQY